MLNLNPSLMNESNYYDDDAVRGLLHVHAKKVVCVKHPFFGLNDKVAYPLYKLACLRPSVSVIRLCHQAFPHAIEVTAESYQRLPLHAACVHGARLETVQYLVKQYPAALDIGDYQGHLPVQLAIIHQKESKVQRYLLQQVSKDRVRFLSELFLLCLEHKSSKSVIKTLLKIKDNNGAFPVLEALQDDEGTALHKAIRLGTNVDIIMLLLKLSPELVSIADEEGWLPLHDSVGSNHKQVSVVSVLVQTYPAALTMTTNLGCCPLHLAIRYNAPFEIVQLLCNEETAQLYDCDAHYPLHFACRAQSEIRVICLLLKRFGAATAMEDNRGMTPLHLSCKYHKTEIDKVECDPQLKIKVITLLVKADPDVLMCRDDDGYTPLDLACLLEDGAIPFKAKHYMALQNGKIAKKRQFYNMIQGNDDDHYRGGSPMNIMFSQERRDGESSGETR